MMERLWRSMSRPRPHFTPVNRKCCFKRLPISCAATLPAHLQTLRRTEEVFVTGACGSAVYAGSVYRRYELEQSPEKSLTRSNAPPSAALQMNVGSSRTCIVHEIFIRIVSQ